MTKILYIWQAGYPWDVRAEKICQELRGRGCEVTMLARWKPGQPAEEILDGIRVVRVGQGLPRPASLPVPVNPVWQRAISRLVNQCRPDLVISREIMLAEPAARACRSRDVPMVIDMAEHYPATMRTWDKYRRGLLSRLLVLTARIPDRVERRAVALADGVITVCDEQSERLNRDFKYPRERMTVVHNTLDSGAFDEVRKGSSQPPKVFAHHGYVTSQRGLDNLVRGFALAARQEPGIELDVAGSGETANLSRIAHDLGVQDRVNVLGPYEHGELIRLYSRADVGMLAYPVDDSWGHTIPNKLFDYLACGKPVIVSPIGPFRRVVETARAGLVLASNSPEDVAAGILRIRHLNIDSMVQGALEAARTQYHWERDAVALVDFLNQYTTIAPGTPSGSTSPA